MSMLLLAISLTVIVTGAYLDFSPRVALPWPLHRLVPPVFYGVGVGLLIACVVRVLRAS